MAGGVLKGLGITMIVVGGLALLGGLGAAAYGFFTEQQNQEEFLPDPDAQEMNRALVVGGGIAAGVGLVLVILGITLTLWGASRTRAETAGRQVTMTAPLVIAGSLITLALAGLVIAVGPDDVLSQAASTFGPRTPPPVGPLDVRSFNGTASGVSLGPLGSANSPGATGPIDLSVPSGSTAARVELAWQDSATALRLVVERSDGGTWEEVGRASGTSPLALDVTDPGALAAKLRARIFVDGAGATPDTPYTVYISSFAMAIPAGYSAVAP